MLYKPALRAARVTLSTLPVATMVCAFWYLMTAALVFGPKNPLGLPVNNPFMIRIFWSSVTSGEICEPWRMFLVNWNPRVEVPV